MALHANVSTATVSRALNNPEKVAEKKRLQIQAAIDVLGYIPDGAARALASRHTKTIGAVVPTWTTLFLQPEYRHSKVNLSGWTIP